MDFIYHHRTQGRGGEGVHIVSIVRALEAHAHTVDIVSPPGVEPRSAVAKAPADKSEGSERGIHRLWRWVSRRSPQLLFEAFELIYNVYAVARVASALRRRPAAIVYERYAFFLFIGVLLGKLYGRPVILEVNEVAGVERARGQLLVGLARWIERRLFLAADRILVVSSFLRQRVIEHGVAPRDVVLIPNAVDPGWLEREPSGEAIRRRYGLEDAVVAGFVGWFDDWDRLDLLIDALARLRDSRPALRLLLVGSGPMLGELRRTVRQRDLDSAVLLTGPIPRERIPSYIDAMDICVLPDSNPFGSPIVLFEFMGRGKPVVAPDLPPITDVVEHDTSGWIVQPGDIESLVGALERLIAEPELRRRLGAAARSKVRREHTWFANGGRVSDLARDLVG